jgi:hypothetical protein
VIYVGSNPESTPNGLFGCPPKAGIFLSFGTNDSGFQTDFATMSVGFIDEDGDVAGVVIGAKETGFDYTSTETDLLPADVPAGIKESNAVFVQEMCELTGLVGGWNLAPGAADSKRILYQALFGDTMETAVGLVTLTSSGDVSVSGLPFQPDLVIVAGAAGSANGVMNVGAIDEDGNQWSACAGIGHVNEPSTNKNWFRFLSDALCQCPNTTGFTGTDEWEYTGAITSDGFDLTAVTNPSGARVYAYLAIRDPSGGFAVGSLDSDADVTGLAFDPETYMAVTCFTPDDATYDDGTAYGMAALFFPSEADNPLSPNVTQGSGGLGHNGQELLNPCQTWRYTLDRSEPPKLERYDYSAALDVRVDFAATVDGLTTDTSVGSSVRLGWICLRGSAQADCPNFGWVPRIIRYNLV